MPIHRLADQSRLALDILASELDAEPPHAHRSGQKLPSASLSVPPLQAELPPVSDTSAAPPAEDTPISTTMTTSVNRLALLLALLFGFAASAQAQVVTNLDDSGPGSLRQALADAPEGGTITFQSGLTGTITLGGESLDIARSLTIEGPGNEALAIDADRRSRVFYIGAGGDVTLRGLTIRGGSTAGYNHGDAALYFRGGGGLYADGAGLSLTLDDVTVADNIGAWGAGLSVRAAGASLTVAGSVFRDNAHDVDWNSVEYGAGISFFALGEPGTLRVETSLFESNRGEAGAAIAQFGTAATVIISGTTFRANTVIPNSNSDTDREPLLYFDSDDLEITASRFENNLNLAGQPAACIDETLPVSNVFDTEAAAQTCGLSAANVLAPGWTGSTATVNRDGVEVRWQSAVTAFPSARVYRLTSPTPTGGLGQLLATLPATEGTYTDFSATPQQTYRYCVVPTDGGGTAGPLCTTVETGFKIIPPELAATEFENRVVLGWPSTLTNRFFQLNIHRRTVTPSAPANGTPGPLLALAAANAGTYADNTGTPMQAYEYCLTATDASGVAQPLDCETARRVIRPVEAFTATQGTRADEVRLGWRNTSELVGRTLRVYRAALTGAQTPADAAFTDADILADGLAASTTNYRDADAAPGARYAYAVATVAETVPSDLKRALGFRAVVPAPIGLAASDGTDPAAVDLAWTLGQDFDLTGFSVYRELLAGPDAEDGALDPSTPVLATVTASGITAGSAYTYTDASADPSAYYEYCVVTNSSAGASAPACDAGSRTGLNASTDFTATQDTFDDRIELAWTDAGPDETGYVLGRRCAAGREGAACPASLSTAFAEIARLGANVTSYIDRDVAQGIAYEYRLEAITAAGAVSAAVTATGTRADVLGPTRVTASDGAHEDRVEITWTTDATTAMVHNVYRDGALIGVTAPDVLTLEDAAIASDVDYAYCVSTLTVPVGASAAAVAEAQREIAALLGSGGSTLADRSQRAESVVARLASGGNTRAKNGPTETPQVCDDGHRSLRPPTAVTATDAGASDDERWVRLTWTDASGAEAGYRAYRWRAADQTAADAVLFARTGPSRTQALDSTGVPGTRYLYAVRAYDGRGPAQSDALGTYGGRSRITDADGELLDGRTDEGRRELLAASDVLASDGTSETEVTITWTDNSAVTDRAGYRVYRWPSAQGAAQPAGANVVCTTGPKVSACIDTDYTAADYGVDYTYRVATFDAYGESSRVAGAPDQAEGGTVILPPADLHASTGYADRIVLVWNDVSAVNTGYRVERDGVEIALLGDVSTYVDAAARAGTQRYQVRAVAASAASAASEATGSRFDSGETAPPKFGLDLMAPVAAASAGPHFGYAVGVDEEFAAISDAHYTEAYDSRVFMYERVDGAWRFDQILEGDNRWQWFGVDVDVNDGAVVVGARTLGAPGVGGKAFVYVRRNGFWEQTASFSGDARFGERVTTTGTWAFITNGAQTNIYRRSGGSFAFDQQISFSQGFADLGADGEWLVGAAHNQYDGPTDSYFTAVKVYRLNGGAWGEHATYRLPNVPRSPSVEVESDRFIVGAGGGAYVFRLDGTTWSQELTAGTWGGSVPRSGVGLSRDGDDRYLMVAQPDAAGGGQAQVYRLIDDEWIRLGAIQAPATDGTGGLGRVAALTRNDVLFGSDSGRAYFGELGLSPSNAAASDGAFDNRIQIRWTDRSEIETGFRIYRSSGAGEAYKVVATVDADVTAYNDFDVAAGSAYDYCVVGVQQGRSGELESERTCDKGWLPPDGRIGGRVASREGAGVGDIGVCLAPSANRALLLDGVGSVTRTDALQTLPSSFTLEAWVKRSRNDVAEFFIGHGVPGVTDNGLHLGFRSDGGFTAGFWGNDLEVPIGDIEGYTPTDWNHWAVTVDGATRAVYLNGAFVASGNGDGTANPYAGAGPFVIGAGSGGNDLHFAGLIDEVRLWTGVRSPAQIAGALELPLARTEEGLLGYWPFDQHAGIVAPDVSETAAHLDLIGGAHWATGNPSFDACRTSDDEGAYTFTGLRYGEGQTFEVRPSKEGRAFLPGSKSISLSPETPVENQVDFTDASVFTFEGTVSLGIGVGACAADSVQIYLDGAYETMTKADGTYSMAVQPTSPDDPDNRTRTISARRVNAVGDTVFAFRPAFRTLEATENTSDLDFGVTTKRVLGGFAGGSCGIDLGTVTLRVYTEDGCFDATYTDDDLRAGIGLAPQRYLVEVIGVDELPEGSQLSRADILAFFDGLGTQSVDLTYDDAEIDLVYRAPVEVLIAGMPAAGSCPAGLLAEGRALPNVPVIQKNENIQLTITAQERYSPTDTCPIPDAQVAIRDGFRAQSDTTYIATTNAQGEATHATKGQRPEVSVGANVGGIDRSYQRALTATVDVPGRDVTSATVWAVVEGTRTRTSEFVSATTGELPILALHDPPGSESYAYLEKGTTLCREINRIQVQGASAGVSTDAIIGGRVETGFGVSVTNGAGAYLTGRTVSGGSAGTDDVIEVCTTTTERLETHSDPGWVGEDLFMGVALNLIFARADVLGVDECALSLTEGLAANLDESEPFSTTYVYGESHIQHSLIPSLERLVGIAPDAEISGTIGEDEDVETIKLADALASWNALIDTNQVMIDASFAGGRSFENRSFSAGTVYEYSHARDSLWTKSSRTTRIYFDSQNDIGVIWTALGYDNKIGAAINIEFDRTTLTRKTQQDTREYGYVLTDNDGGDFFSVDVGTNPRYGTPTFRTRSGRSSNPHEANTQARDKPVISINPPLLTGVPPDEAGTFEVTLSNQSESGEVRRYVLAPSAVNNTDGLTMRAGGAVLGSQTYTLDPGESVTVKLDAHRSASVYDYRDVALYLYPKTEFDIWTGDTRNPFTGAAKTSFGISYQSECSPVALQNPETGWRVRADLDPATGLPIPVDLIAHRFELDDTGDQRITFEYRRDGGPWEPIANKSGADFAAETGPNRTQFIHEWTPVLDGTYELRAYSTCLREDGTFARNETLPVEGLVDRVRPQLLGDPSPEDGVLNVGDGVALTFTEALDCRTASTTGSARAVGLRRAGGGTLVPTDAACSGTTLMLVPAQEGYWSANEGDAFEAFITPPFRDDDQGGRVTSGLRDAAGNPLALASGEEQRQEIVWPFIVRRSLLRFAPRNLSEDVSRGTPATLSAKLVNDAPEERTFALTDVPAWLSLRLGTGLTVGDLYGTDAADTTATLPPGGELPLTFDVAEDLPLGPYAADVRARTINTDDPAAPFEVPGQAGRIRVALTVSCTVPTWELEPSLFAYSMQVAAEVVDALGAPLATGTLAAYVGADLRGVTAVQDGRADLTAYSSRERGEAVRFVVWEDATCTRFDEAGPSAAFEDGKQLGTPSARHRLYTTPPETPPGSVALATGWTWFSLPFEPASADVNAVLADLPAAHDDRIMGTDADGQAVFATYDGSFGAWLGSLTTVEPGQGYQLYLSSAATLDRPSGADLTDPAPTLAFVPGWNWAGYRPGCPLGVNDALAGLSPAPSTGDIIKGQRGFAVFDRAEGWQGSLVTMQPGEAYQLRLQAGGTLAYPTNAQPDGTGACTNAPAPLVASSSLWRAAPESLPHAMTLVVAVEGLPAPAEGDPMRYEVVAFQADDAPEAAQVRGVTPLVYVPERSLHLAYLTAYGSGEPSEALRLHLGEAGGSLALRAMGRTAPVPTEALAEAMPFAPGEALGSPSDPVRFDGVTLVQPVATSIDRTSEIPAEVVFEGAAPNPFATRATLHFGVPQAAVVRIDVYDALGRSVRTLVEEQLPAGYHTATLEGSGLASGVYFVRLSASSEGSTTLRTARLVLTR